MCHSDQRSPGAVKDWRILVDIAGCRLLPQACRGTGQVGVLRLLRFKSFRYFSINILQHPVILKTWAFEVGRQINRYHRPTTPAGCWAFSVAWTVAAALIYKFERPTQRPRKDHFFGGTRSFSGAIVVGTLGALQWIPWVHLSPLWFGISVHR